MTLARKPLRVLIAAIALALGLSFVWPAPPDPERQLLIAGLEATPFSRRELAEASLESLMLLDGFGPEAYLAGRRYPQAARTLYATFGTLPEFRNALENHGYQQVLPVVWYFWRNESLFLEARSRIQTSMRNLGNWLAGSPESVSASPLTSVDRAWVALTRINERGSDFLGHFTVDSQGEAHPLRLKTTISMAEELFVGHLESLEKKYRVGAPIHAADLGWAATDVALLGLTGWAAARGLAEAGFATRVAAVEQVGSAEVLAAGSRVERLGLSASRLASAAPAVFRSRIVQFGFFGFGGWLLCSHPQAFNAAIAVVARALGLPPMLLQVGGWSLAFLVPVYLLSLLLGPIGATLLTVTRLLDRFLNPKPRASEV